MDLRYFGAALCIAGLTANAARADERSAAASLRLPVHWSAPRSFVTPDTPAQPRRAAQRVPLAAVTPKHVAPSSLSTPNQPPFASEPLRAGYEQLFASPAPRGLTNASPEHRPVPNGRDAALWTVFSGGQERTPDPKLGRSPELERPGLLWALRAGF